MRALGKIWVEALLEACPPLSLGPRRGDSNCDNGCACLWERSNSCWCKHRCGVGDALQVHRAQAAPTSDASTSDAATSDAATTAATSNRLRDEVRLMLGM